MSDRAQLAASTLASPLAVSDGPFAWWRDADARARRAFVAAALGWMLDSFDVMLYSLVLAALIQDPTLQLSTAVAGQLGAVTLLAAAAGGVAFGIIADRIGRKRALMAAVLIYSVFTAACGLAQTVPQLAVFRVLLGLGMGGEWATGVGARVRDVPRASSRQGAGLRAELVGDRLRAGGRGQPGRDADLGLARRLLRRRAARALHDLDPPQGRRAGDVAPHAGRGAGARQRALHAGHARGSRCSSS